MTGVVAANTATDAELVRAAQAGDAACLGYFILRHEATLRAVALNALGYNSDVDDALQEATIIALRRIGELRDPKAALSWMRTIVRNVCRMHLRSRRTIPVEDLEPLMMTSREPDLEFLTSQIALRDWVWDALEGLTPGLRLVTMLRYFSPVSTYQQIAALCGIPVGTVRSRLASARATLADLLRTSAASSHGDSAELSEVRRLQAQETMVAIHRGQFGSVLAERWSPRIETTWPQGKRTQGFDYLVRAMDNDLGAGVRQQLIGVTASSDVTIWEANLISPPEDPFHCPPAVVWVQFMDGDQVRRLRLFHPQRGTQQKEGR